MPQMKKTINYHKMADVIEEIRFVGFEFLSDIYEQCHNNETVIRLLTNALLQYCYLPIVIPALVGSSTKTASYKIGISTALFICTMTFKHLKSKEL